MNVDVVTIGSSVWVLYLSDSFILLFIAFYSKFYYNCDDSFKMNPVILHCKCKKIICD